MIWSFRTTVLHSYPHMLKWIFIHNREWLTRTYCIFNHYLYFLSEIYGPWSHFCFNKFKLYMFCKYMYHLSLHCISNNRCFYHFNKIKSTIPKLSWNILNHTILWLLYVMMFLTTACVLLDSLPSVLYKCSLTQFLCLWCLMFWCWYQVSANTDNIITTLWLVLWWSVHSLWLV